MRSWCFYLSTAALVLCCVGGSVDAAPPQQVNFQGVLRDSAGVPLDAAGGPYPMRFRYFDAETGGNEALVEEQLLPGVAVIDGLFNVALGSGALSDGSGPGAFTTLAQVGRRLDSVYLEIEVNGEVLTPRIAVLSAPYALQPQRADGACTGVSGNTDRFVDCGNGTVTDGVTGLTWLQDANCFAARSWWDAHVAARTLGDGMCGLGDGSAPGDWRLPTREEWQVMVDQAVTNACSPPTIPDDSGLGCCDTGTCSFSGIQPDIYWGGSASDVDPSAAWSAVLFDGNLDSSPKSSNFRLWPVRDAP